MRDNFSERTKRVLALPVVCVFRTQRAEELLSDLPKMSHEH